MGGLPPLHEPLPDCMSPRGTKALGTLGSVGTDTKWGLVPGPWYTTRETMNYETRRDKKEKNGYPFTTFTDSSDFLAGVLPSVVSHWLVRRVYCSLVSLPPLLLVFFSIITDFY